MNIIIHVNNLCEGIDFSIKLRIVFVVFKKPEIPLEFH